MQIKVNTFPSKTSGKRIGEIKVKIGGVWYRQTFTKVGTSLDLIHQLNGIAMLLENLLYRELTVKDEMDGWKKLEEG